MLPEYRDDFGYLEPDADTRIVGGIESIPHSRPYQVSHQSFVYFFLEMHVHRLEYQYRPFQDRVYFVVPPLSTK